MKRGGGRVKMSESAKVFGAALFFGKIRLGPRRQRTDVKILLNLDRNPRRQPAPNNRDSKMKMMNSFVNLNRVKLYQDLAVSP